MISVKLLIFLLLGTLAMLVPMIIQSIWYKIKLWKSVIMAVLLTVIGTLGTYIWFFVENLWFGGRSFYGAIFIVPIVFIVIPKFFRISYGYLMDLCAPAECIMLAIMKAKCLIDGCCGGRILFETASGEIIRFPSQIAELIVAILLCIILMFFAYKPKFRGTLYLWYMVLYGLSRFILNFFRDVWGNGTIPFGTIWSVFSVIIGIIILITIKYKNKERHNV